MRVKNHILVVEDNQEINDLLSEILTSEGYEVQSAFSGTEAKLYLEMKEFHLILLDLMLPGLSGEALIKEIRKTKTLPIIVISAKIASNTKVEVLKLGADDFISKPFDNEEVLARVEAQLRRYCIFSKQDEENQVIAYKNLTIDSSSFKVHIKGEEVNLTGREFKILRLLASHPKKVYTRAVLFEQVWEESYFGDDNTVNVHISNLRSKLAKVDPTTEYIETVWGIGFKMCE